MAFDIGSVLGHLKLDRSDWDNAVKESIKEMDKLGKSSEHTGHAMEVLKKSAHIFLGIAAGLGAVGAAAIKTASDANEMGSKFNAVFKEQANDVRAWAKEYSQSVNRSTNDNIQFLATIQDTLVPLGFARSAASEMSKEVIKLATDLGSFNNLPTAQVVADIQSAIVGNTETLRKYGVVASQEAIIQEALTSGLIKQKGEIDANTKAQAIYQLIVKGTADAQGDALRTADSFANVLVGFKASLTDLATVFGDQLLPAASAAVSALTEMVQSFETKTDLFSDIGEAIKSIMDVVIAVLPTFLDLVDALAPIISTIMDLAVTLIQSLKPAFDQIVRIINILAPIVDKLFQALSPLIEIIADNLATELSIVADLLEAISPIINVILDILKPLFEILKPICHLLGEVLKPIIELLFLPLKLLGEAIENVTGMLDDAINHWSNLAKANQESIENLEKLTAAFEKNEAAIKAGTMKKSELLKMEADLKAQYPELIGQLDLVNKSYEENRAAIDAVMKQRKLDQVALLEKSKIETITNLKAAQAIYDMYSALGIFGEIQKNMMSGALDELKKKLPQIDDQIAVAKQEYDEFGKAATEAVGAAVQGTKETTKKVNEELTKFQQEYADKLFDITATEQQKIDAEEKKALKRAKELGADTTNITAYYSQKRIEIYRKEYEEILKQREEDLKGALQYVKDAFQTETQVLEDEYKKRAQLIDDAIEEAEKTYEHNRDAADMDADQDLETLNELLEAKKKLEEKYRKDKAAADEKANNKWVEDFKAALEKIKSQYALLADNIWGSITKFADIWQMGLDNEVTAVRNTYGKITDETQKRHDQENENAAQAHEIDIRSLENQYKNHLISTAEYNRKKQLLDDRYNNDEASRSAAQADELTRIKEEQEAKEKELKRKAFEGDKVIKIAQVWVDLARSIMEIWTVCWQLGPIAGPIFAGIMTGVMTGLAAYQTATIASQQFPEYAAGGVGSGFAIVGEQGPELIHLGRPSRIYPAGETAAMRGAGGMTVNFNGPINQDVDVQRVMSLANLRYQAMMKGTK
jgi:hypothetical protein